jgi:DNA (cytosine-5)-methyltransferase 1
LSPGTGRDPGQPWRRGWELTEEQVEVFSKRARRSFLAKSLAMRGEGRPRIHPVYQPRLDPATLMPPLERNGLKALSVFSGGGGLDLGFDAAGFEHVGSFDILDVAGETLRRNRGGWAVHSGPEDGDVRKVDWGRYRGSIDVLHGGPPCTPFSQAGRGLGDTDARNMIPEFVRAVRECRPAAFLMENVAALGHEKFRSYLDREFYQPLTGYRIASREVLAESFGVPQRRKRLVFVGFKSEEAFRRFRWPLPTHSVSGDGVAARTMGVREALGLPDIGFDGLAPTIRSGFSGPRGTTSINNSASSMRTWTMLGIWPNGVAATREAASMFAAENGTYRLSVQDCGLIQGFLASWVFCGPVYAVIGQIGNAVSPPVAYRLATALAMALRPRRSRFRMRSRRDPQAS